MGFKKTFKTLGSLFTGDSLIDRMSSGTPLEEAEKKTLSPEQSLAPEPQPDPEGELAVDVYETPDNIVVKAMIAGVPPHDLNVEITREMVTIRGERRKERQVEDKDYFHQELYWGSFSRTIVLPQEIDVEESEAREKNGMLVITLPKIDKKRMQKLKIKEE